jgi:glutathione-dependent peroxiredoxin
MMNNREGQSVPQVTFKTRQNNDWIDVSSDDIFKDRIVVVFSLPGAFTPTCSSSHLPRYNELAHVFKENGVDDIVCMSVNDAFVMNAWNTDQESENITLIPDGNGEFSAAMDMLVDKSQIGFGKRSWRYSMLVKNGVIEKQFIEADVPGDPFEVSDADTMLSYINPKAEKPKDISIISKPGCPFCAKAKQMLNDNNMSFDEISIGTDAKMASVKAISGFDSVPQVFIDGQRIGGSEELAEYLKEK